MLSTGSMILNCACCAGLVIGTTGLAALPPSVPAVHLSSFDRVVEVARICRIDGTGLWAGQHTKVGRVAYGNNLTSLFVGYQTTGDWYIKEVHLEVVAHPSDFPVNGGGSPEVGQFRYQQVFEPPTQEVIFQFYLNEMGFEPGQTIYVAAHAVVCRIVGNEILQTETAWGRGIRFGSGSWAMYDDFTLGLCR